jgi:hypothetical protein
MCEFHEVSPKQNHMSSCTKGEPLSRDCRFCPLTRVTALGLLGFWVRWTYFGPETPPPHNSSKKMGFQLWAVAALLMTSAVSAEGDAIPKLWKPSGKKVHDPWKKFCGKTLCYDVLEVAEDATESEIKKSYRKLAREWHPDKNPEYGAREKFQKIAKAYETLSTDGERAKYDHLMANPAVSL